MDWPGGSWEATARWAGTLVSIYLLVLWLSLLVWTYQDVRDRSRSTFLQVFSILLVFFFNLLGLFVYLIVRPRETLAEANLRALEEEAMIHELEEGGACPNCNRYMDADFLVCPFCTTPLKEPCAVCSKPLQRGWAACPYCGSVRRLVRAEISKPTVPATAPEGAPRWPARPRVDMTQGDGETLQTGQ